MISFIGPSYELTTRKADVQRVVNMYPMLIASGTGKSPALLQSIPGLTLFSALTTIRGMHEVNGRLFAVSGSSLYELSSAGTATLCGTLASSTGAVDMAHGLDQLVIVDGSAGYVLTLATNALTTIGADGFYGSARIGYLDGYFIAMKPDSQQYGISTIDDATAWDALDFASSEGAPDPLVSFVVSNRELWLFGSNSVEVVYNAGGADFPFARNSTVSIELGCCSPHAAKKLANGVYWVSSDSRGAGVVWRTNGYQPERISTQAVEEKLAGADLSTLTAYTYHQAGDAFYCINADGLDTTWVFEASSGQWHERAELALGEYAPHRGTCHAYAFGRHLIGAATGVYELDATVNTNAGDPLVRDRVSPHAATPDFSRNIFPLFELDVTTGEAAPGISPVVSMRYSDDGGATWSNWLTRSLGLTGAYSTRVRWHRTGQAIDRVWQVRCTDDVEFSIIGANAPIQKGAN